MKRIPLLSTAAIAASVFTITAAGLSLAAPGHKGGHGHGDGHGQGQSRADGEGHAPAIGHAGEAGEADRTVHVKMRDIEYDRKTVTVSAGEIVHFVIRNEGALVHEFNIATAAMHQAHQDEMAKMMEKGVLEVDRINREKMHDSGMSHHHANSVLLGPGESAELTWVFPEKTELEFACNVPGHYESGMVGDFRYGG